MTPDNVMNFPEFSSTRNLKWLVMLRFKLSLAGSCGSLMLETSWTGKISEQLLIKL